MGVLQFPTALAGSVGVFPTFKYMVSTDNLATLLTPGYLNPSNTDAAQPMLRTDMVAALYNYNQQTMSGTYGLFTVSISNLGVITLGLQPLGEEISWTPTLTFATPGDLTFSYGLQLGNFAIIGSVAVIGFVISATPTYTTASGNLKIMGIPVAPAVVGCFGAGVIQSPSFPTGTTSVSYNITGPGSFIQVLASGSGNTFSNFTTTQCTSGAALNLQGTISYFIS